MMFNQIKDFIEAMMSPLQQSGELLRVFQLLNVCLLLCTLCYGLYKVRKEKRNKDHIFKDASRNEKNTDRLFADFVFKELYQNIQVYCAQKGKSKVAAERLFYCVLILLFALFLYMCSVGQMFLGILFVIGLKFMLDHITRSISLNFADYMEMQIPSAIDNITRIFSKIDDVRSLLYESSVDLPQPLQGILQSLSTQMSIDAPDIVLQRFMEINTNPWAYTMIFILYNYVCGADKRDTILSLRDLKLSLENEKKIGTQERMERKMTVMVNYALCAIAIFALFLNLTFNSTASTFFFSTLTGLLLFILGIFFVVVSVFFNIMIMRGKK